MFRLKPVFISGLSGFLVSFIAGIIGGVGFGIILLRAVLSAVFMAALASGLSFFYGKFFQTDTALADVSSSKPDSPPAAAVNIVLDDAELPDSPSAPGFFVNDRFAGIEKNESDDAPKTKPVDFTAEAAESKVRGGISAAAVGGPAPAVSVSGTASGAELETLPDIENLVGSLPDAAFAASGADASASHAQLIEDSMFAEIGDTKPSASSGFDTSANAKDIAAAIRTILKKDA